MQQGNKVQRSEVENNQRNGPPEWGKILGIAVQIEFRFQICKKLAEKANNV